MTSYSQVDVEYPILGKASVLGLITILNFNSVLTSVAQWLSAKAMDYERAIALALVS